MKYNILIMSFNDKKLTLHTESESIEISKNNFLFDIREFLQTQFKNYNY